MGKKAIMTRGLGILLGERGKMGRRRRRRKAERKERRRRERKGKKRKSRKRDGVKEEESVGREESKI